MSEVAAAPVAPSAPPAQPVAAPEGAPAGETPAPQTAETPPAPAGETPVKSDEQQEKARHRRQLNTAYRKAAEERVRRESLEREIAEFKAKAAPAEDPGAPKLENFKDIESFGEAKAKHAADKALKEHEAKQQTETQKQAHAKLLQGWEEKAESAAAKYDDFEDAVGDIQPTTPWAVALMRTPNGGDVAYHLGKNPSEARRIHSLHPIDQFIEIGLLSAKLSATPPTPKTPSRAPAPIKPLTGAAPVASDVPSEQDDFKTWMRKRSKQVHGR